MQEFTAGATAAPDFDLTPTLSYGGVNLCEQSCLRRFMGALPRCLGWAPRGPATCCFAFIEAYLAPLVVKATTLAAGRIECGMNLDVPTETVVTVNPLIGAPYRRSAHLNFQQSR
jgi:hypothetical protein